nr:hypothetical protein [Candidatus Sigynarchaeota archaeon]
MGYDYYRKVADKTEEMTDAQVVDQIIKYNVLPTIASGTLLFCMTMFLTMLVPYTLPIIILSFVGYFAALLLTFGFGSTGKHNTIALVSFYGLCFATGLMQRPVLLIALMYLGNMTDVIQLFSIAVVAATAVLLFLAFVTRTSTTLFSPGSGFMRHSLFIVSFLLIGSSIWMIFSLMTGNWDWYLLISSLVSVAIVGIYSIWDLRALRYRVASGRWVLGTASLALNYF